MTAAVDVSGIYVSEGNNMYLGTASNYLRLNHSGTSSRIDYDSLGFFQAGSTQALTLASNGKVGVNNSSPNYNLDVSGTANVSGVLTTGSGIINVTNSTSYNVAFGYQALNSSNGVGSIALGYQALYNNSGNSNIAIGYAALTTNGAASNNVAIGNSALKMNTGGYNTAVGFQALTSNTTASENTAFGSQALAANTEGTRNTGLGTQAGFNLINGVSNTIVGRFSGFSLTNGSYNTAVGESALCTSSSGSHNTAFGYYTLVNDTTGHENTAFGTESLRANTTGYYNTAVGRNALLSNIAGFANCAVGFNCLSINTSGNFNVAMGPSALYYNTIGVNNVAIGHDTLYNNISGGENVAIGNVALHKNQYSKFNVAIGTQCLNSLGLSYTFAQVSEGGTNETFDNVSIGQSAAYYLSWGKQNVFIGSNAGNGGTPLSSGHNNIYIGTATSSANSVSNEIVIGQRGGKGANTCAINATSGLFINGFGSQFGATTTNFTNIPATFQGSGSWIAANFGSDASVSNGDRVVIGNGGNGNGSGAMIGAHINNLTNWANLNIVNAVNTTVSDARLKENIIIADNDLCYKNIKSLNLVRYNYKENDAGENLSKNDKTKLGVLAQELREIFPKSVSELYSELYKKSFLTVNTDQLYYALLGCVKHMQDKLEFQDETITLLKNRLNVLENK